MNRISILLLLSLFLVSFNEKSHKWVAIGDSITYLNDHQDETDNRISKGYMTLVAERLPEITFVNKGYNGWTAVRVATEIEKLGIEKADIYTVFLGTNDWWQGKPAGTIDDYLNNTGTNTFCGSYRIILDKLRSLNPKAVIVLFTPMQRGDFVYVNNFKNNAWGSYREKNGQLLSQFVDAVEKIGEVAGIPVVDLYNDSGMTTKKMVRFKRLKDPETGRYRNYRYPGYTTVPFNPETDEYPYPENAIRMTYDGLHPSDRGYKIIAKMLIRELRRNNLQI